MAEVKRWESKGLDCWNKAKEIRNNYYRDYAEAHQRGWLRWVGGAVTMDALAAGLGDDVAHMTSEGYGASIGNNPKFSLECQEAVEAKGFARDMCAYLRNYWGSMYINKYLFGGEFPKPDFALQTHVCCMHGKWYQLVQEYEGCPHFCIDVGIGASEDLHHNAERIEYVANQALDAIEWMEKITGRKYDDEKFREAVFQEARATSLWAEICSLNKAIPAPLDEKSNYSLYVLLVLYKSSKEVADFYEELRDEVKDRVARRIAAVPTERLRLIHDGQPPWSFLKMFRYLEQYGAVVVGSFYTLCLEGAWRYTDGHLLPATPPRTPEEIGNSREEVARFYADWFLTTKPIMDMFHVAWPKSQYILSILKDWQAQGAIMHFNRGCEGLSLHVAENRLALVDAGIPVVTYEGNMADDREFDEVAALNRIEAFMESLGLKKIGAA